MPGRYKTFEKMPQIIKKVRMRIDRVPGVLRIISSPSRIALAWECDCGINRIETAWELKSNYAWILSDLNEIMSFFNFQGCRKDEKGYVIDPRCHCTSKVKVERAFLQCR